MATSYKVLAQSNPSGNTLTTVYTVPAGNSAVVSTISACNTTNVESEISISIHIANASLTTKQYITKDLLIPENDTFVLTLGVTLGETDTIRAECTTGSIAINVFGSEVY